MTPTISYDETATLEDVPMARSKATRLTDAQRQEWSDYIAQLWATYMARHRLWGGKFTKAAALISVASGRAVTANTFGKWTNGTTVPEDPAVLRGIAQVFGVPEEEVFSKSGVPYAPPLTFAALLAEAERHRGDWPNGARIADLLAVTVTAAWDQSRATARADAEMFLSLSDPTLPLATRARLVANQVYQWLSDVDREIPVEARTMPIIEHCNP